ncbi:MAG: coenzyme F420-0:L-glutamate ligase [Planctomycetes bacterium]|jgi:coenzyme F420-0:L-glutamate ligase|nr:coenzyme F420-0:L-glutamate ligase [Planctomycetota bacterium]
MKIKAIKTRIFKPSEKLLPFIEEYLPVIKEKDIVIITSKIVALSEGRVVKKNNEEDKERIIREESDFVLPTKYVYLTIKDGICMANAGIDESNANDDLILLPKNSFTSAIKIRKYFKRKYSLKKVGVIITDSRCLPLRAGITGVALGYAGIKGLKDYRQSLDIFGRPFEYSHVDVADSLATAAVLCMGEGNERRPLALIQEAPVEYSERLNRNELKLDIKDDMYKPIFEKII